MSVGCWSEGAASDSRAVTAAVRSRVRKDMKRSVLDDSAWPLILLRIFCPHNLAGAPTLSCCGPSTHSRNMRGFRRIPWRTEKAVNVEINHRSGQISDLVRTPHRV